MDKNSAIGFGLLLVLLVIYVMYNNAYAPKPKADSKQKTELSQDSISRATAANRADTLQAAAPEISGTDSGLAIAEQETTLENNLMKVTFTNKGAYPKKITLKNFQSYKTFDSKGDKALVLFDGNQNSFDFEYQKNGVTQNTKKKSYNATVDAAGKSITFVSPDGLSIAYTLPTDNYMMDMAVNTGGIDKSKNITLFWKGQSIHTEREKETESRYSQVCFEGATDGYDTYDITDKKSEDFDKQALKWVTFKRHFFNTTIIPKGDPFTKGEFTAEPTESTDTATITNFDATLTLKPTDQMNFQYYAGPNDYELLKGYNNNMQEIVPLSYGIFGFVKYINKGLILPLFHWLSGIFNYKMGLVIIVLTFIIRLLMSPLTYKSYVSSAKMKALKPELDELKEQYKDDKQAFGVEQMKLYKTAGVNPLGGCLPALLQMPIFFALFSFFPHAIELRQKGFAWANDLSSYDSIIQLPFNIPFYGDHVSLFTILFAITSILLALYSMNNATMDQSNPVMKYMPFIMPLMFLGIFNSFAAALTLYYFVSNLITLGLQVIIQKFIINPDKIRAKILAKKNEPVKESKFMQKMKELQERQVDQAKTRGQRRK